MERNEGLQACCQAWAEVGQQVGGHWQVGAWLLGLLLVEGCRARGDK